MTSRTPVFAVILLGLLLSPARLVAAPPSPDAERLLYAQRIARRIKSGPAATRPT